MQPNEAIEYPSFGGPKFQSIFTSICTLIQSISEGLILAPHWPQCEWVTKPKWWQLPICNRFPGPRLLPPPRNYRAMRHKAAGIRGRVRNYSWNGREILSMPRNLLVAGFVPHEKEITISLWHTPFGKSNSKGKSRQRQRQRAVHNYKEPLSTC